MADLNDNQARAFYHVDVSICLDEIRAARRERNDGASIGEARRCRGRKEEEEEEGEAKCESDNETDRARRREYRAMEVVQTRSPSIGQAN